MDYWSLSGNPRTAIQAVEQSPAYSVDNRLLRNCPQEEKVSHGVDVTLGPQTRTLTARHIGSVGKPTLRQMGQLNRPWSRASMDSTVMSASVAEKEEHVFLPCFGDRDSVSSQGR